MDNTSREKLRKRVFLLSLLIFLIALSQPAFYIDRVDYDGWSSPIGLILVGWLPILAGEGSAIAWLANPLIIVSWVSLFKMEKISFWTSLASIAFALSFLFVDEIMSSEAPTYSKVTEIKLGYWLWVSSMVTFSLGALYLAITKKSQDLVD